MCSLKSSMRQWLALQGRRPHHNRVSVHAFRPPARRKCIVSLLGFSTPQEPSWEAFVALRRRRKTSRCCCSVPCRLRICKLLVHSFATMAYENVSLDLKETKMSESRDIEKEAKVQNSPVSLEHSLSGGNFDHAAERRLLRKLDARILPVLWILYLVNFIDRYCVTFKLGMSAC